jgi:hypothetical protein
MVRGNATVLEWLRSPIAPPPSGVTELTGELVASKARTREMGVGPVPVPVREFIVTELYAPHLEGTGRGRVVLLGARSITVSAFRLITNGHASLEEGEGHVGDVAPPVVDGERPSSRSPHMSGNARRASHRSHAAPMVETL